ncbi:MAG TPA: transcriptional repressor LexA [Candidatus Hypogeohydataceae bacterium YC41]
MFEKLTPGQSKFLSFLKRFYEEKGYPPTVRETKEGLGITSSMGVQRYFAALEEKGYIKRSGKARAIEFRERLKASQSVTLPLVGHITAGAPSLAIEDIHGYVAVDRSFTSGDGNFLLKVKGDSMIEAHIKDGDYVVVKPQPTAENGDIVAALVDTEAMVKRFYRKGRQIKLAPANPTYKDIVIKPGLFEIFIVGKVIAVLRSIMKEQSRTLSF